MTVLEFLIAACVVIGGLFGLVGSVGLFKLNDSMSRLHAPTKATTLGVGGVLVASMIHAWAYEGHVSVHELLITLFLLITAPVTANFIAKVYINRHTTPGELPKPGDDPVWATHDTGAEKSETPGHEGDTTASAP